MNREAQRHLDKAKSYIEKGDQFHRRAADEIIAAMKADPSLTQVQVGEWFGYSGKWVSDLVSWRTNEKGSSTKLYGGRELADKKDLEKARRQAEQGPAEEIAEVVRKAIKRPEVREAVARQSVEEGDDANVSRLSIATTESMVEANKGKTKKLREEVGGKGAQNLAEASGIAAAVHVMSPVLAARRKLAEAYQNAIERELSEDVKEVLEEEFGQIEQIIEWFRSYLADGDTFDDEVAELLGDRD
jgi:hypothetical protein